MAITYTGRAESADTFNQSSISKSITVNSGELLIMCIMHRGSASSPVVSGVTFNGSENFSLAIRKTDASGFFIAVDIWYLLNPTVTTANVTASWSTVADKVQYFYCHKLAGCATSSVLDGSGASAEGVSSTISCSPTTSSD